MRPRAYSAQACSLNGSAGSAQISFLNNAIARFNSSVLILPRHLSTLARQTIASFLTRGLISLSGAIENNRFTNRSL